MYFFLFSVIKVYAQFLSNPYCTYQTNIHLQAFSVNIFFQVGKFFGTVDPKVMSKLIVNDSIGQQGVYSVYVLLHMYSLLSVIGLLAFLFQSLFRFSVMSSILSHNIRNTKEFLIHYF